MLAISGVAPGSIAEEGGAVPGERLLSVNGRPVRDVLDYRFLTAERELAMRILGLDGEEWELVVSKDEDEDPGFAFDDGLGGGARRCANRCVFCFIDQLPRGMRESLYFKDDDWRLSITNGNYVTLTNMGPGELARVLRYRASPVNVSVHAADPSLRRAMLGLEPREGGAGGAAPVACGAEVGGAGKGGAGLAGAAAAPGVRAAALACARGDAMPALRLLTGSRVAVNAQVVLCKGWNDGPALDDTLAALGGLNRFMESVSVVPCGLTSHRGGLPRIEPYDREGAARVLRQLARWRARFLKERGQALVYPADEFFLMAGRPLPGARFYGGFPQLENGVGMLALFRAQFARALRRIARERAGAAQAPPEAGLAGPAPAPPAAAILTGEAAAGTLRACARALAEATGAPEARVIAVPNRFFGPGVTVAGLLCGRDVIRAARAAALPPGARALVCRAMLRHGTEDFLDDVTLAEVREALNLDVQAVDNDGAAFARKVLDIWRNPSSRS